MAQPPTTYCSAAFKLCQIWRAPQDKPQEYFVYNWQLSMILRLIFVGVVGAPWHWVLISLGFKQADGGADESSDNRGRRDVGPQTDRITAG
jgi:hypothetical protein